MIGNELSWGVKKCDFFPSITHICMHSDMYTSTKPITTEDKNDIPFLKGEISSYILATSKLRSRDKSLNLPFLYINNACMHVFNYIYKHETNYYRR